MTPHVVIDLTAAEVAMASRKPSVSISQRWTIIEATEEVGSGLTSWAIFVFEAIARKSNFLSKKK